MTMRRLILPLILSIAIPVGLVEFGNSMSKHPRMYVQLWEYMFGIVMNWLILIIATRSSYLKKNLATVTLCCLLPIQWLLLSFPLEASPLTILSGHFDSKNSIDDRSDSRNCRQIPRPSAELSAVQFYHEIEEGRVKLYRAGRAFGRQIEPILVEKEPDLDKLKVEFVNGLLEIDTQLAAVDKLTVPQSAAGKRLFAEYRKLLKLQKESFHDGGLAIIRTAGNRELPIKERAVRIQEVIKRNDRSEREAFSRFREAQDEYERVYKIEKKGS